jgi:ferredoxin-type protein NapF
VNSISRAQFLRGDWRGEQLPIRPPRALPEPDFSDLCDGCGECVSACNENILRLTHRKLPLLDFALGACTFCADCAAACPTGALNPGGDGQVPAWTLRARISSACLAQRGTYCVRCVEECEHGAITALPAVGGRTKMRVNSAHCTGCGACVAHCPVDAVRMEHADRPERTR